MVRYRPCWKERSQKGAIRSLATWPGVGDAITALMTAAPTALLPSAIFRAPSGDTPPIPELSAIEEEDNDTAS